MRKSGGIIGLIAGIFGFIAAIVTMFIGGIGAAVEAEGADTIMEFGWLGIVCSFLTIVLGAVAMGAKGRVPGVLLIICAIGGAITGGTLVAIPMGLAFIGGILAAIPGKETPPVAKTGTDA